MVTNADIIYQFKTLTDSHQVSDDNAWFDEWIHTGMLYLRASVVSQKYRKNKHRISAYNEMITPCINLVKAVNCTCVAPSGCEPLMTSIVIPDAITGIISITNPDGDVIYNETDSSQVKHRSTQRFKSLADKTFYTLQDEGKGTRIYIFSKKPLKYIRVTLIPRNPIEIQRMKDCSGRVPNFCVSNYDLEWKLDADLTNLVLEFAAANYIRMRYQGTDLKNNSMSDNIGNKQELIGTNS